MCLQNLAASILSAAGMRVDPRNPRKRIRSQPRFPPELLLVLRQTLQDCQQYATIAKLVQCSWSFYVIFAEALDPSRVVLSRENAREVFRGLSGCELPRNQESNVADM